MCDVMTALAVAGGVASFVGSNAAASDAGDAAEADLQNKYAQEAERRKQINEQYAVQANERDRQQMIDEAEAKTIAGESGLGGFNTDRLVADSMMQMGMDLMSMEQNRSNEMKQSSWNDKSYRSNAQSITNTAYAKADGILETGLNIGTSIAKGNAMTEAKTLGPTIKQGPRNGPSHLKS